MAKPRLSREELLKHIAEDDREFIRMRTRVLEAETELGKVEDGLQKALADDIKLKEMI